MGRDQAAGRSRHLAERQADYRAGEGPAGEPRLRDGASELRDVERASDDGAGGRHLVVTSDFAGELTLGESVAVNGVCLTVVEHDAQTFRFQAGPETLHRSNLGELVPGDRVNLERSLRLADRL